MELSAELMLSVSAAVIAAAGTTGMYVLSRMKQIDREYVASEARCHQSNAELVKRIEMIEDRSHKENREERAVFLLAIDRCTTAFAKLADRRPDVFTPTKGHGLVESVKQLVVVLGLVLGMTGCDLSSTRSTSTTAGKLSGTYDGKPVELIYASGSEANATQSVDSAAIAAAVGRSVGDAAGAAVRAAIPGAGAIADAVRSAMPPPADDTTSKVVAGAGVAGTLLASILAALKAREASRHRDDADEAWDRLAPAAPATPRGSA